MTGKRGRVRKQRVKLPTMGLAGLLCIVQRLASVRLKQIEEVALGSLESGAGAPDMEEAIEAILRIMEGRGGKAAVDAELEAAERGGDGRHRALTCTKQGQLPFEGDSCPCLSICEVFFCCPSKYVVGRNASVYDE